MIKQELTFSTELMLQRRTAAHLVNLTNRFKGRIMIEQGKKVVNAKSLLGILSLADNPHNEPLYLVLDGSDEQEALEEIVGFLKSL